MMERNICAHALHDLCAVRLSVRTSLTQKLSEQVRERFIISAICRYMYNNTHVLYSSIKIPTIGRQNSVNFQRPCAREVGEEGEQRTTTTNDKFTRFKGV